MIPFIFQWEGISFENDPSDPGGATKFGIDLRSYAQDHPGATVDTIRALNSDQATQIYWDDYWNKFSCEAKPFPIGEVFFNACVNCGFGRASTLLELATGGSDPSVIASNFLDYQDSFYQRLANARPASQKFLSGWLNRTEDLRKFLTLA